MLQNRTLRNTFVLYPHIEYLYTHNYRNQMQFMYIYTPCRIYILIYTL